MEEIKDSCVSNYYFCNNCNKKYIKKSSLNKHKILCDFKFKSNREQNIDLEEALDIPSYNDLVKIVQDLSLKVDKMEKQLDDMKKINARHTKKINVLLYLNNNITPNIGFIEWVHTKLIVAPEHFDTLMENNLFNTIQQVFEYNLVEKNNYIYPITCFNQKTGIFYIYDVQEDSPSEWRQMILTDILLILKTFQNKMINCVIKWKDDNKDRFNNEDKVAIIFNKALGKLMNISFTQDNMLSRIKNGLYNYLKKDIKTFDIDF